MNKFHFILFLLTVCTIYFLMHYFVFVRSANGLRLSPLSRTMLAVCFWSAGLSFFMDRFLGRYIPSPHCAYLIFSFGNVWLGIIAIAFSIFLMQFFLLLFLPHLARSITIMAVILVFVLSGIALFRGTRSPRIKEMEIPIQCLPSELTGFSVVQLSDLHLHKWKSEKWLRSVVEKANRLHPDLVVITGDLVEDDIGMCERFAGIIKQLESAWGIIAIPGNHEFYSGIESFMHFARNADATVLRNGSITVAHGIQILGVDDEAGRAFGGPGPDLRAAMERCDCNRPLLLLSHRPTHFKDAVRKGIDLQLSGHTHAGQIPPMDLMVSLIYRYPYGLYRSGSSVIYTTCGTGIWGPPMRLFSHSEVVKFSLVPHHENQKGSRGSKPPHDTIL